MTSTESGRSLVVVQLSGGNDYVNTIVPYTNGRYYDARPNVSVPEDQVLPIDGELGFSSSMEPIKGLWDQETVAIIHGVGYPILTVRTSAPLMFGTPPCRRLSARMAG